MAKEEDLEKKDNLSRYRELALKRLDGSILSEEAAELAAWLDLDDGQPLNLPAEFVGSREELEQRMLAYLSRMVIPVVPLWKKVTRVAAAAAVLVLLAGGGWYWDMHRSKAKITQPDNQTALVNNDIAAPGSSKAILTLSNGKQVLLDSAANRTVAMQGNTKIVKLADGQIAYDAMGGSAKMEYNTLAVPRGSNVTSIALADGTKVWLNAGSTLIYPVAFMDKERTVEMTGEAYFEVAANANMPFIVKKRDGDVRVKVLGTRFNANMYDDEAAIKVTLLDGSVNVVKGARTQRLHPGQQAEVSAGDIYIADNVDIEAVMAWKNEQFLLKGTDVPELMRQIARWYDVDIQYTGKVPDKKFGGSISKDVNLSSVLQTLEEYGVKCTIEGKNVIVE